jgi:hypothetical protein
VAAADSGYGDAFWPVWRAVVQDYRAGAGARARARLGFLTPPEGRGRVVWVKAGGTPESLRLGVELVGAVRERRKDVRIVITFEHEDPELLRNLMQPGRRVGIGYGPCDRPAVVRRVLRRFQPCGILLAESEPPGRLLRDVQVPVAAVGTQPPVVPVKMAWPLNAEAHHAWESSGRATELMKPADPQARFTEAQADVVLRVLAGGETRRLWWWHGAAGQWPAWLAAWRAAEFSGTDVLLASLESGAVLPQSSLAVSRWDRRKLPGGSILHLDDPRWLAPAASAAHAIHLAAPGRTALWQSLAAGAAVTLGTAGPTSPDASVPVLSQVRSVIEQWRGLRDDEQRRRRLGDAARRRFWEERRQVDTNLATLMDQVWTW